ncbi:unnamed protein product [Effrenium voratum]|nr:unnamed protein product [Effrenium voratum]CAJ1456578.1 unnamed protein product [Effrenium voratum]
MRWPFWLILYGRVLADEYPPVDEPGYWDKVYQLQASRDIYEWYGIGYEHLRPHLLEVLKPEPAEMRLMVVGSGDSALSAELAVDKELAHWQVVSIDFSSEVTERMKRRFPGLSFLTMDARNLSEFGDGHFGAVLDKGLSDCIGTTTARQQYFQELRRVVVTGGRLIVVSQRVLNTEQDIQEDIEDTESDLGPGWICSRKEILSSLFEESDPRHPPFAKPGTENSIPYFLLRCTAEPFATV